MAEKAALTDAACRKFKPHAKRRRIRDTGSQGLFLIVQSSGRKSFQMRVRTPTGRIGKLTLGRFDPHVELENKPVIGQPLTLAAARLLAAQVRQQLALGQDPIADLKANKDRARAMSVTQAANTFAAAARAYIAEYAKPKTRRWWETAKLLGLHPNDLTPIPGGLAARWAEQSVDKIDGHDCWGVVDEAKRVGIPGRPVRNRGYSDARARALATALSGLFGWLLRQRRVKANPCVNLDRPVALTRDRVLSADEIRWFWQACSTVDAPHGGLAAPRPFEPCFRLLLLTGCRLNEVAGMRRDELSADLATWTLPGSRTKNKRAHVVPLPPRARELVTGMVGRHDLVFTTTGHSPPGGWVRAKRRLDATMLQLARNERGAPVTIPPWRLHDLRRTAVTGMAELGIRPDVIELAVNHVSGHRGGIAGVYNRSELLGERKAALERWSAHVEALVKQQSNNVLALHPRREGAA
jgi:integrase